MTEWPWAEGWPVDVMLGKWQPAIAGDVFTLTVNGNEVIEYRITEAGDYAWIGDSDRPHLYRRGCEDPVA